MSQLDTPGSERHRSGPGATSVDERVRGGKHVLSRFGDTLAGVVVKLLLLAGVTALGCFMIVRIVSLDGPTWAVAGTAVATLLLVWVYLGKRRLPLKYLIPGTVFLIAFQLFPFVYTFYIAFTNYGLGQRLTQEQAIERIEADSVRVLPDAPRFRAVPFADNGDLALLLIGDDGQMFLGSPEDGLIPVDALETTVADDEIVAVDSYERLSLGATQDRIEDFSELRIPIEQGEIQLQSLTTATVLLQTRFYDPDTGTLVDEATGDVYVESGRGRFVNRDDPSDRLSPGWRVLVGTENFARAFTDQTIRGPFARVLVWTYVFALLSTVGAFVIGLGLAIAMNDPRVKGRRVFRLAMIVPYALPTFITALIWRGMMNRRFGVINDLLGMQIPWLNDPNWARLSVVLVNLWFGFPYMFLICTAALQSIPSDIYEAAAVDGSTGWGRFRWITLPLLLVATAPVLVATFAFNFNNFNVVFLLTGGNPPIAGATTPVGHTDILISYTYRIAFESGGGQDFGLGATIAIATFVLVAAMALVSFRWVRPLEEINE